MSERLREIIVGKGSRVIDLLIPERNWRNAYAKLRLWFIFSDHYKTRFKARFDHLIDAYQGGCRKGWMTALDCWLCWIVLGAEPDDYFDYEFFRKGWLWRNHHITKQRLNFMDTVFNTGENGRCLDEKQEFYRQWDAMLRRKWCEPQKVSFEEFEDLFGGMSRILVKPTGSFGGKGIYAIDIGQSDMKDVYQRLHDSKESIVAEEYVCQKGFLNDISPASLNPLRVTTLRTGDDVTVLYAFFTAGCNGNVVANDCSGGICYPVDTADGKLGLGQGRSSNNHAAHPDTGIKVAGEYVPHWDQVKAFACQAHRMAPEGLNLIGWDVCVSGGEISLIEGNRTPGFPELPDRKENQWKRMKAYLDRFSQMKE